MLSTCALTHFSYIACTSILWGQLISHMYCMKKCAPSSCDHLLQLHRFRLTVSKKIVLYDTPSFDAILSNLMQFQAILSNWYIYFLINLFTDFFGTWVQLGTIYFNLVQFWAIDIFIFWLIYLQIFFALGCNLVQLISICSNFEQLIYLFYDSFSFWFTCTWVQLGAICCNLKQFVAICLISLQFCFNVCQVALQCMQLGLISCTFGALWSNLGVGVGVGPAIKMYKLHVFARKQPWSCYTVHQLKTCVVSYSFCASWGWGWGFVVTNWGWEILWPLLQFMHIHPCKT